MRSGERIQRLMDGDPLQMRVTAGWYEGCLIEVWFYGRESDL